MAILFSPSACGFFHDEVHSPEQIPQDAIEITEGEHVTLLEGQAAGKRIVVGFDGRPSLEDAPAATQEQLAAATTSAVQRELDRQAQLKGYDNILSACSYAAQPVGAPFQAEGAAFLAWRSAVWTQAYAELDDVRAGTKELPTPEEAVASMPPLVLPT